MSAEDLFSRYFTNQVWGLLVQETNQYAAQYLHQYLNSRKSRMWYDVDVVEIIGVMIAMGLVPLPRLYLYLTTKHPLLKTAIREHFTRDRFLAILAFLHLNDSEKQVTVGQPGYDPLFKVRPLLDLLSPLFESQFDTYQQLSVDEAMIPFKGRLGFKQYMKDKPTKWGIKVFVLADAHNGYVKRFQIYTGKNSSLDSNELGLCSRVIVELLSGFEYAHPQVYMDNYYTSPSLFLRLYNCGVNACGTARNNRLYFPEALKLQSKSGVPRGYIDYRSSGPLLATV
jgi:hypothetical protein